MMAISFTEWKVLSHINGEAILCEFHPAHDDWCRCIAVLWNGWPGRMIFHCFFGTGFASLSFLWQLLFYVLFCSIWNNGNFFSHCGRMGFQVECKVHKCFFVWEYEMKGVVPPWPLVCLFFNCNFRLWFLINPPQWNFAPLCPNLFLALPQIWL